MPVQSIKVFRSTDSEGLTSITISWDSIVPDEPWVIGFNIYRKSSNDTEWKKLNNDPITVNFYLDYNADYIPGIDYYYTVTYIDHNNIESEIDTSVNVLSTDNQEDNVIRRVMEATSWRTNWGLNLIGESAILYIKKVAGRRCPECWEEASKTSTNSKCPVCYGTGIVGGYEKFDVQLAFSEYGKKFRETEFGIDQVSNLKIYMGNYPILSPFAIVVRQNGNRYMVSNTNPIIVNDMLIQQTADVNYLNPEHIGWKLQVPVTISNK